MLRKFLAETVTNGSIGLDRPKGYIPLGQRQKKPLLAVVCLDFFTLFVCFLVPLWISKTLEDFIFFLIFGSIVGSCFWLMSIHVHSFYIQQNATSVKWRNWRFKTREFDYSSITVFFDATYIYHMILFRERYGVWPPKYIPELFVEFGDYEDMDALIKVICYARTYEIGSPEAGEYRQIPEHLQRILDRAAAESK